MFGAEVAYFGIFVAEDGLEVHFAQLGLVGEDFAARFESGMVVSDI